MNMSTEDKVGGTTFLGNGGQEDSSAEPLQHMYLVKSSDEMSAECIRQKKMKQSQSIVEAKRARREKERDLRKGM